MLFNSLSFLFLFLPITLLGFYIAGKRRILFLCLASIIFYAIWNPWNLLLLLPSIGINYLVAAQLLKKPSRTLLGFGVAANILFIAWFKYAGFLAENINAITAAHFPVPDIVLPLGISFFTLHQICYLIDSHHQKTRPTPFSHYVLYVTFFPQLIAGPIVRFTEVMDQYIDPQFGNFDHGRFARGIFILCIGLCKKVLLADYFSTVATPVFSAAHNGLDIGVVQAWLGAIAYSFQIYFDFSAYSDMAIGLGNMFGITLPLNFNSPYQASSIIEFWRRWHMTLSRFLRDYLYIPLGGNRQGTVRRYANLLIVMLIGGLWHGAAWTFVIWGGLHGFYLLINHAWHHMGRDKKAMQATDKPHLFNIAITFLAVTFAWIFFRSETIHTALVLLKTMAGQEATQGRLDAGVLLPLMMITGGLLVWCMPNASVLSEKFSAMNTENYPAWRKACIALGAIAGLAVFLIFTGTKSEFIYFQF